MCFDGIAAGARGKLPSKHDSENDPKNSEVTNCGGDDLTYNATPTDNSDMTMTMLVLQSQLVLPGICVHVSFRCDVLVAVIDAIM